MVMQPMSGGGQYELIYSNTLTADISELTIDRDNGGNTFRLARVVTRLYSPEQPLISSAVQYIDYNLYNVSKRTGRIYPEIYSKTSSRNSLLEYMPVGSIPYIISYWGSNAYGMNNVRVSAEGNEGDLIVTKIIMRNMLADTKIEIYGIRE